MPYALGIDVGTTFTAAAVWRDERVEVVALEAHRVTVPTVIAVEGDELRYGSGAISRGITNPDSAAREFKRRLGDSVPIFLAGAPYSADRLVALFARWVYDTVVAQTGETPTSVAVTHPANWTEFQRHLLSTALEQAGVPSAALIPEPQAATIDFGSVAHMEPGQLVLVYDLGGGTFDVAILQRDAEGFTSVGVPAGVERLGGIDFDEAVFEHVLGYVPQEVIEQARNDPTGRLGLAQLRARCVEAKESLSSDVSVDIPVLLPGLSSTVRLTRQELEDMVRPMLRQTVELAQQALDRAQVSSEQLSAVLLVGGSSRIPLVSELVGSTLGAPVRVDAHPKLVVARGAARWAATQPANTATPAPSRRARPVAPIMDDDDDEERPSRRRVVIAAVAAVVLIAGGILAWRLTSSSDEPSATPTTTAVSAATSTDPSTSTTSGTDGPTSTDSPRTTAPGTSTTLPIEPSVFPAAGDPVPPDVMILTRLRSDGVRQLWSADLSKPIESRATQLTATGGSNWDNVPALSKDRRLIAFTSLAANTYTISVKAWTGGVKGLRVDDQPVALASNERATWAPDGTRLAYVANRNGADDLFVYDAETQTETQLTHDDLSESDPSWSPTSDAILFTVGRDGGARDVMRIAASGGEAVPVTSSAESESDPSWSPDATRIAFTRESMATGIKQVLVANADGSGERPLIDPSVEDPTLPLGDSDPSWSPDGTRIAFESDRQALQGIWVVGVDAAAPPELVISFEGWITVHPAWT